jgi:hypothetical protein
VHVPGDGHAHGVVRRLSRFPGRGACTPLRVRSSQMLDASATGSPRRALLADSGRATVGDIMIGEVVAHVPPHPDDP